MTLEYQSYLLSFMSFHLLNQNSSSSLFSFLLMKHILKMSPTFYHHFSKSYSILRTQPDYENLATNEVKSSLQVSELFKSDSFSEGANVHSVYM